MANSRNRNGKPPKAVRSKVSNGSALFLEGVDGRSALARRFRDLYVEILADVGSDGPVSEAKRQLSRRAASLAVQCENVEAGLIAGNEIDVAAYLSLVNSSLRTFALLGLERKPRDVTPSPVEWAQGAADGN